MKTRIYILILLLAINIGPLYGQIINIQLIESFIKPTDYMISSEGGFISIDFHLSDNISEQQLQSAMRQAISNAGISSWLTFDVSIDTSGDNKKGVFILHFSDNQSDSRRSVTIICRNNNFKTVQMGQGGDYYIENSLAPYYIVPQELISISLNGSASNRIYTLLNDDQSIDTKPGTGKQLTFQGKYGTGLYTIKNNYGTSMYGTMEVRLFDHFEMPHLMSEQDTVVLNPFGGTTTITCSRTSNIEIETLNNLLYKFNMGYAKDYWTDNIQMHVTTYDESTCEIQLTYPPNLKDNPLIVDAKFIYTYMYPATLICKQEKGIIKTYKVSGKIIDDDSWHARVELSGSQENISYTLFENNVVRETKRGTGAPLTFDIFTGGGIYTITATIGGNSVNMAGHAILPNTPFERKNQNWILKKTYTDETGTHRFSDIVYYDGLGYPEQNIGIEASPAGNDIITPIYYDAMRRDNVRIYLPYIPEANAGQRVSDPFTDQGIFYSSLYPGETMPYIENIYQASPLDRISETYQIGMDFRQNGGKKTSFVYETIHKDEVLNIKFIPAGLEMNAYYNAGTLYKKRITNADDATSIIYTNTQDLILLIRNIDQTDPDGIQLLDTYYVYDEYGNLCYVLPPELSIKITAGDITDLSDDGPEMRAYAYIYKYDYRKRCIAKKLPGTDWSYMLYDLADKLVMSQDANLRNTTERWQLYRYDALDRITSMQIIQPSKKKDNLQQLFDTKNNLGILRLYQSGELIDSCRYDTYEQMPTELEFEETDIVVTNKDIMLCATGLLVYERRTKAENAAIYLEKAYYYDYRGRVIQIVEHNHLGGISRTSIKYDFLGNILIQVESHSISGQSTPDIKQTTFTYDHRNRLLSEKTRINESDPAIITYRYNETEKLATKIYGTGTNQLKDSLTYDIRGWLRNQRNPEFVSSLYYHLPMILGSIPSYTGNISEWEWRFGDTDNGNTYIFSYDGMARLKETKQHISGEENNLNVEKGLTYDRNGNILTLQRTKNGTSVDNLIYSYIGNQLTTLSGTTSGTYAYDLNGNMTHDGANNFDLTYNKLNMIETISQNNTILAKYSYLSDGTKLSATDADGNGLYYLGSLVYNSQNGDLSLESAAFSSGRFIVTSNGIESHYFVTDHLGSVRAVVNNDGEVIERNHYYPFGMRWNTGELSDNRYRYNGKEDQTFVNVSYTDYGARMYNGQIGRWFTVDLLAENHYSISPYVLCNNNPIRFEDKDGRDWKDKVAGVVIGMLTNIIPSSSLRESYTPNDAVDYNIALAVTDARALIAGNAMSEGGEVAVIAGAGITVAAGAATLATAGVAGEVTVPAMAAGKVITWSGAATKVGGELLMFNATKNAQNGYNYGATEKSSKSKAQSGTQYKRIGDSEIKAMKKNGFDPHDGTKPKQGGKAGKIDYYKGEKGTHYEETGVNINDYE